MTIVTSSVDFVLLDVILSRWKNRARETLYSGCLLTLLDTKKRATKVAIKLTPARAILTGDFFRSFGFRPGRRGN